MKTYVELKEIMKNRNIANWKSKVVTRKYAFEMPIPHGEHKFLKVVYPVTSAPLPQNMKGTTFETMFGSN
jgi:DNA polymerase alpha subunit A